MSNRIDINNAAKPKRCPNCATSSPNPFVDNGASWKCQICEHTERKIASDSTNRSQNPVCPAINPRPHNPVPRQRPRVHNPAPRPYVHRNWWQELSQGVKISLIAAVAFIAVFALSFSAGRYGWFSGNGERIIQGDAQASVATSISEATTAPHITSSTMSATPEIAVPSILADTIPGSGGYKRVDEVTDFTFTPDRAGTWIFQTSNNGNSDPFLWLYDANGTLIVEDDDGEDGLNSLISAELTAGVRYTLRAGFYENVSGGYNLAVERVQLPTLFTGHRTARYDGGTYEGYWIDDLPNGRGKCVWSDGSWYEGDWQNGNWHGTGTYVFSNGDWYEGDWRNGQRTGQGVYNSVNNGVSQWTYTGAFVNGDFHGQGKIIWADGQWYEGDWHNDKRTGRGMYHGIFSNTGESFYQEGEFLDGSLNGHGTVTYANGDWYTGRFDNGILIGEAILYNSFGEEKGTVTMSWE